MGRIKIVVSMTAIAGVIAMLAAQSTAYPPFLVKAKKFGAKDCRFCHVNPEGGAPFNPRGQWLLGEKERRHAESVDPEWLAAYRKWSKRK